MNVCFVGDSLVLGFGAPACLGWPGRVCARAESQGTPFVCYNLGVRGAASLDVKNAWVDEAARRLPKDVPARLVFSFGAADANRNVDPDQTLAAAKSILSVAREMCPTAFVGPPPLLDEEAGRRVADLGKWLAGVCTEVDVPFLDACTPLSESRGYMADLEAGDGVHPGARGYDELSRLVWGFDPIRDMLTT
jgi:lysophospholipase L1-like esterase